MNAFIKIFIIFVMGLTWFNYPQTAYSLGVAPYFKSSELYNTGEMKKCSKCGELKDLSEFGNNTRMKDGLQYVCKNCKKGEDERYRHSKKGVLSQIYGAQKERAKINKYIELKYTKKELGSWLFSHPIFNELFANWKASNFNKSLAISIDRINDYKGYSFDNIQLMTWDENRIKYYSDAKNGINNKMARAVIGTHRITGKVIEFYSCIEAERQTNINNSRISDCCNKKISISSKRSPYLNETAGGYYWKFKNIIQ